MDTLLLRISGNWGHFKKPETNNNPLTHDFLTKTALIGMVGAVLGKDRESMRPLFPQLSDDLKYGLVLEKPVKKQAWAFTLRRFEAGRAKLEVSGLSPRPFEFLKDPCFRVAIALADARSRDLFETFAYLAANSETHFDPVLGLHNCPAELSLVGRGQVEEAEGPFRTAGFVPRSFKPRPETLAGPFRAGFEWLPSYQNAEMWNPRDRYVEVVYMDVPRSDERPYLTGEGTHYQMHMNGVKEEAWCLI